MSRTERKPKKGIALEDAQSAGEMDSVEEDEGYCSDEAEKLVDEVFKKHSELIGQPRQDELKEQFYDKMLLYLDCDMNLLIYGVGSKIQVVDYFLDSYIKGLKHDFIVCRPFMADFSPINLLKKIDESI